MLARREFLAATAAWAGGMAAATEKGKPPIKIGQIGVGHGHATKLAVYRASPDYEVVGLVEPDPVLRRQAEASPVFRDLPWMTQEQLLNVPGLQAVLVETTVRHLLPAAETCIAAGKHIHLDKPAGDSLPHFRRILHAARDKGLLVQLGYMYRYNPGVVLLRDVLARGWLGEVFEVHAVMSKVVGPADRVRFAEFSGGIMFELGCHVLDLVLHMLGRPNEVTPFIRQTRTEDGLADNMLVVLGYDRALATVKSTALEVEGFERRHLVVCGTEGTIHIQPLDRPRVRLALARGRGDYRQGVQDIDLPQYVRYVDDAADMARVLRGEKRFEFSYDHDLLVQETLLRACRMPVET
jgi:predicted dehydrogenase